MNPDKKDKIGRLRRRKAKKKAEEAAAVKKREQEEIAAAKKREREEVERQKAEAEKARNAEVEAQILRRRATRNGDPTPIEILFEKGKQAVGSPQDRIRYADSVQAAVQKLFGLFKDKGDVLATVPRQVSETEWTFDADFLNGILHCTVTCQEKENDARFWLTDWTPEIRQELEASIPQVLGAVQIGRTTTMISSVRCEVRDTDDPQKRIIRIENPFCIEKEKHVFTQCLYIRYFDPDQPSQPAPSNQDGWEEFDDTVEEYEIFANDRFPIFFTDGSAAFCGYMFQSWHALAVSAHGALYMNVVYDEPWTFGDMVATELTDAFVEDILYAYELRYNRKLRASLKYDRSEHQQEMDGRYCVLTIEPAEDET